MSKEPEVRHYNKTGGVVRPRDPDGHYVIQIIWRGPDRRHASRWTEKSGWLKADPKTKTKFATWKELWAYKAKHEIPERKSR